MRGLPTGIGPHPESFICSRGADWRALRWGTALARVSGQPVKQVLVPLPEQPDHLLTGFPAGEATESRNQCSLQLSEAAPQALMQRIQRRVFWTGISHLVPFGMDSHDGSSVATLQATECFLPPSAARFSLVPNKVYCVPYHVPCWRKLAIGTAGFTAGECYRAPRRWRAMTTRWMWLVPS